MRPKFCVGIDWHASFPDLFHIEHPWFFLGAFRHTSRVATQPTAPDRFHLGGMTKVPWTA